MYKAFFRQPCSLLLTLEICEHSQSIFTGHVLILAWLRKTFNPKIMWLFQVNKQ